MSDRKGSQGEKVPTARAEFQTDDELKPIRSNHVDSDVEEVTHFDSSKTDNRKANDSKADLGPNDQKSDGDSDSDSDSSKTDHRKANDSKADLGPNDQKSDGDRVLNPIDLNPVESLLLFNMIRFNIYPENIDWEKVAQHSQLKSVHSAKVRFRQFIRKNNLEDVAPATSRRQRTSKRKADLIGFEAEDAGPSSTPKPPRAPRKRSKKAEEETAGLPAIHRAEARIVGGTELAGDNFNFQTGLRNQMLQADQGEDAGPSSAPKPPRAPRKRNTLGSKRSKAAEEEAAGLPAIQEAEAKIVGGTELAGGKFGFQMRPLIPENIYSPRGPGFGDQMLQARESQSRVQVPIPPAQLRIHQAQHYIPQPQPPIAQHQHANLSSLHMVYGPGDDATFRPARPSPNAYSMGDLANQDNKADGDDSESWMEFLDLDYLNSGPTI